MRREEIELLAPAGSYEGFEAAIGAGADAVYVGGAAFGARAYAKNFGEEELLRAIDTAHIHGRKLYLTVNTLLKNRELSEQLYDYLLPYYKEGLDAGLVSCILRISSRESSLAVTTLEAPCSSRNFIPSGPVTVICVLA